MKAITVFNVRCACTTLFVTKSRASFRIGIGNGDVRCAVNLVAAHEVCFSLLVDLIRHHGRLMPNWREEAVPGVHSDVGGGYIPTDQGITNDYSDIQCAR